MANISKLTFEQRETENYLKGYQVNRKLLKLERYEKEYLSSDDSDIEAFGEAPLARARMFEIRHFVMKMENSEEKLLLYYRYIKG
jgi:CHASE3 domain sensor protein